MNKRCRLAKYEWRTSAKENVVNLDHETLQTRNKSARRRFGRRDADAFPISLK